jgi:ligand-binding sensor domain-containing protein/signal transduction histidine kinase
VWQGWACLLVLQIGNIGGVANQSACQVFQGALTAVFLSLTPAVSCCAADSLWFARPWDAEEGLPNNTVEGIAQTADGYLWLGTPSGLVRFDGVKFEDYSPTNFIAPPNRGTIAMLHDRNDALWLALDRGAVVRLQAGSVQAYTEGLADSIPNGLAQDAQGEVWVAYRGGAVYHIKDRKVTACNGKDGLPGGSDICALTSDNKGRIWFAKAGQIGIVRNGKFETIRRMDPVPARLTAARRGGVWLCLGFKLFRIEEDGNHQEFGEFHPGQGSTVATAMLEDHEGAVWIGTSFSGLFRHDEAGFDTIQTTHQEILSLAEDREGNLWVGTAGGGLNRVRRRAITLEGPEEGLPYAAVPSICEDASGTLWAVTQNGVVVRRIGGQWSCLAESNNMPMNATCVTADSQGSVWIGTRLQGLYCWRDGHFVSWGNAGALRGQTIHTLLASKAGDLWIGQETPPMIHRLRGGRLSTFAAPLDSRIIRAMAEDGAGTIWAGTSKGVLLRIAGDQLSEVKLRSSGELASIRCLYGTPDGALWIGYAGWGIGRLKEGHYAEIDAERGLYDNYVSHILEDGHGWLWFGANRGIFKVRQQDLVDVAEGRSPLVRSIHYGRSEGLPSLQGTFGESPDVVRSRDGRLWIPMRTALAVVDPEELGENLEPPPVLLTRVRMDKNIIASYDGVLSPTSSRNDKLFLLGLAGVRLRLPPGHHQIEFEFTALSFAAPENVQFRHRLGGLEDEWVEEGTRRATTYPRLPAGDYAFQVTACSSQGVWNNSGAKLNMAVAPFLWQTLWFRSAALAAFTFAIIAIVRYVSFRRLRERLRLLEQQAALHKERARIAKDIHDDVGANLTQIALLGELAQQDRAEPEKAAERSGKISSTARQAIKSLDEIVWAVNPRNDTLAHLLDYAGQFALDYLRLAGIRCRLDFPEQTPARELSTDLRHNVFLVVKEATHNIIKHSGATEAWVRATVSDHALEMVVEDNGRGFDHAPDDAVSDGLRNMRQRLADVGGECNIESHLSQGTKVTLRLPWPKG